MGDITTLWSPSAGEGDWAVLGAALQDGDDLATATLISLFTDRQANDDDATPDGDRRGWWGDATMGSRLWLLARAKLVPETLSLAQEYAAEALAWMVDDGVVAAVDVTASWLGRTGVALVVELLRTDGTTKSLSYGWAWDGVGQSGQAPSAPSPSGAADFTAPANSGLAAIM